MFQIRFCHYLVKFIAICDRSPPLYFPPLPKIGGSTPESPPNLTLLCVFLMRLNIHLVCSLNFICWIACFFCLSSVFSISVSKRFSLASLFFFLRLVILVQVFFKRRWISCISMRSSVMLDFCLNLFRIPWWNTSPLACQRRIL